MKTRRGFTLIEMMVVITIMALLVVITTVSVNFSFSRDRTRAAARQIQSFIMGARDRAIYAKEARGVRFILATNDKHTAVAMQYIGSGDRLEQGNVIFVGTPNQPALYPAGRADIIEIPRIAQLVSNSIIGIGDQIEIPRHSGNYYRIASKVFSIVDDNGLTRNLVLLNKDAVAFNGPNSSADYSLLLPPTPLMGSEPVQLPAGVAIDLDGSQVPSAWRPASTDTTGSYSTTMDIMFNPRGNVIGHAAAGQVHLLLADTGDISKWSQIQGRVQKVSPTTAQWSPPAVPVNPSSGTPIVTRDQIVVTLRGNTGSVSVHQVNPTPNGTNTAVADDPFVFAETGRVTNQ